MLSSLLLPAVVLAATFLYWLLFIPPKRLYSSINNVRVIQSRFPGLGAVGFYANRYTFLSKNITTNPSHPHSGIAKFNLLSKIVYHVGGADEDNIRAICTNKDLSFSQGNQFLFAGIAGAGQKGLNDAGEMDAEEKKEMRELAKAISPRRLNAVLPRLCSDAHEAIEELLSQSSTGDKATIDLQESYYPLVFRFTVRVMGCAEYASSPKELVKLMHAFWLTQRNSGFWTTILPWVPQPRFLKRLYGAVTLWTMVRSTLVQRIRNGKREDDYAQDLVDQKTPVSKISRFVIGGLIAGILNTIGTGAYSVAFVGADPDLQVQCKAALQAGLKRAAEIQERHWEDLTPLEKLQLPTLEQWESFKEFEILHLVFKESIRLLLTNSLNRYYPGPSRAPDGSRRERLKLYGEEIEDDCYICFSPPSILHNAELYPEPLRFDPSRYKRGQGGENNDYTFIAWGAGYHKCSGSRFAKLETIVALSAFLLFTDMKTVDEHGTPYDLTNIPLSNLSQSHWRTPTRPMKTELTRAKDC